MTRKLLHKTKFLLTLLGCSLLIAFVTKVQARTATATILSAADNQPLNDVTMQLEGSAHAITTEPASFNYTYKTPGIYKAHFVASNNTIDESK